MTIPVKPNPNNPNPEDWKWSFPSSKSLNKEEETTNTAEKIIKTQIHTTPKNKALTPKPFSSLSLPAKKTAEKTATLLLTTLKKTSKNVQDIAKAIMDFSKQVNQVIQKKRKIKEVKKRSPSESAINALSEAVLEKKAA